MAEGVDTVEIEVVRVVADAIAALVEHELNSEQFDRELGVEVGVVGWRAHRRRPSIE